MGDWEDGDPVEDIENNFDELFEEATERFDNELAEADERFQEMLDKEEQHEGEGFGE